MDPLTMEALGLGLGGLSQVGQAFGVLKSPEQKAQDAADERSAAMRAYLEANLPKFNYQKRAFNPSEYSDVLNPVQENNATQMRGLQNKLGVTGQLRGATGGRQMALAGRQQAGDYDNLLTGMGRKQDDTDYGRAMQSYMAELNRVNAIGQTYK